MLYIRGKIILIQNIAHGQIHLWLSLVHIPNTFIHVTAGMSIRAVAHQLNVLYHNPAPKAFQRIWQYIQLAIFF